MSKPYKLPITYQEHLPFDTGSHFDKTVEARVIQMLSQELVFTIDAHYSPQVTGNSGKRLWLNDADNPAKAGAYTQAMLDAYLRASEPYIEMPATNDGTGRLHLIAPDGVALYAIDLAPILKEHLEPVDMAATVIRRKGGVIGLSMTINGAPHTARSLQTSELRAPDENACGNTYRFSGLGSELHSCDRAVNHDGDHLQLRETKGGYARWGQDGGGMATWDDMYGIQTTCTECGLPTIDLTNHLCDADLYWRNQATQDLDTAFVIDGKHYRPGKGGFGGQVFNLERTNGITWTGELFGQGPVPQRWRTRIPDNAVILSTHYPTTKRR